MIALVPATVEVARAVTAFALVPVEHVHDWPHEDTADALRGLADYPETASDGTFLITEDDVVIGDCGWFGPPDEDGEVEIGYGLAPSARGRGAATEAVQLLMGWVGEQGARSVRAEVLPGNEASIRLLLRLGFTELGTRAEHLVFVSNRDL